MIKSFRKLSGNIVTRMIIGTLIIAFVFWGVSDAVRHLGSNNVVEFKYIKPITFEEFLLKKKENTLLLQQRVDARKVDMLDQEREINNSTLDQMINNRLAGYFTDQYNLSMSDKYFLKNVKELEMFRTELGDFNKADFNSIISTIYGSEKHFADLYKEHLLSNLLVNNYSAAIYLPQMLNEEMMNFYSEIRIVDIAKINLNRKKTGLQTVEPTELSLREFYSNNIAKFELPETRLVKYVEIKYADLLKDLIVTSEEVKAYFQEHQEDFQGKDLQDSKKEIIEILQSLARSKAMNELAKSIEDDVASGISFGAIADKYKLNLVTLNPISFDNVKDIPNIIQPFIENIQHMEDNEVSYPMETQSGVVIFEVDKTYPRQVIPFEAVKDKVKEQWAANMLIEINYQTLAELAKSPNGDAFYQKSEEFGVDLRKDIRVWRNNKENQSIPLELLSNIISLNSAGSMTKVVRHGDNAYIAFIKGIQHQKLTQDKRKSLNKQMQAMLEHSYINGIMSYLKNINQVKIDKSFLIDLNNNV